MPFKTRFVFSVSMDVHPDKEALFNRLYDDEHIPELLKVPGVVSVTRTRQEAVSFSLGGVVVEVGKMRYLRPVPTDSYLLLSMCCC